MRRLRVGVAYGLATLLVGAAPGNAVGAEAFNWKRAQYALTINGSGIDWVVEIPRPLPHHVGLGQVTLSKYTGYADGQCDARGAGYLIPDEVQEGIVSSKGPPDAGAPDSRAVRAPVVRYNPAMSRSVVPDDGWTTRQRQPGFRPLLGTDGPVTSVPAAGSSPVRWESECARSGLAGSGTGRDVNQLGVRLAGGTAAANMDKATGRYQGMARGWATDLRTVAATVGSVTSQLNVTLRPGAEPLIGYRISINNAKGLGPKQQFDDHDVELVGVDVPASGLIAQFNEQVRANAPALKALGPLGLALLAPRVDRYYDTVSIAAPVVAASLGLAAREGTIGQNEVVLLGATRFQGAYDGMRFTPGAPA